MPARKKSQRKCHKIPIWTVVVLCMGSCNNEPVRQLLWMLNEGIGFLSLIFCHFYTVAFTDCEIDLCCPPALGSSPASKHREPPSVVQACLNRANRGTTDRSKGGGVNGRSPGCRPWLQSKPQGTAWRVIVTLRSGRVRKHRVRYCIGVSHTWKQWHAET